MATLGIDIGGTGMKGTIQEPVNFRCQAKCTTLISPATKQ